MTSLAFVFPGQGSQSVGMLNAWGAHPAVRQTLEEASEALQEDVGSLIQNGPKEQLDLTTNTQPVMLVAGVAVYRAWISELGLKPNLVAGHSLGEYAALVAAGVLSLADAIALVRFRAQAMQEAVPVGRGAMAAILGLKAPIVQQICHTVSASGCLVEAANFNDLQQTVIAGSKEGVDRACQLLKEAGAKRALLLPVSAPFHSCLMKPAADRLQIRLQTVPFHPPQISIMNNIDVAIEVAPELIRDALYRQAFGPVRWVEVIQAMVARGIHHIVECGPGKVLAGLTQRIAPQQAGGAVYDPATLLTVKALLA